MHHHYPWKPIIPAPWKGSGCGWNWRQYVTCFVMRFTNIWIYCFCSRIIFSIDIIVWTIKEMEEAATSISGRKHHLYLLMQTVKGRVDKQSYVILENHRVVHNANQAKCWVRDQRNDIMITHLLAHNMEEEVASWWSGRCDRWRAMGRSWVGLAGFCRLLNALLLQQQQRTEMNDDSDDQQANKEGWWLMCVFVVLSFSVISPVK